VPAVIEVLEFTPDQSKAAAAARDVREGMMSWRLWMLLAWTDIKQRYRRSKIGQFWITLSMGLMIGVLAFIYGSIFKLPLQNYLPYLAGGMIAWMFVSTTLVEGTSAFIASEGIIKQSPIPLSIYIYRVIWRNFLVFMHNALVLLVVFPFTRPLSLFNPLLLVIGLVLVLANLFIACLLMATFSTRFRDFPPIVASMTQILFYVTPILYEPSQLPAGLRMIAHYNPFYHLINVLRAPLTGEVPEPLSYAVSVGLIVVGGLVAFSFFSRFRGRIAYWL
jgi:lipopolysaccharide transport system permease protein